MGSFAAGTDAGPDLLPCDWAGLPKGIGSLENLTPSAGAIKLLAGRGY